MRRASRWVLMIAGLAGLAVLLSPIVLPTRAPETPQFGGSASRAGGGGPPVSVLAAAAKVADVPIYIEAIGTVRALNTVTVNAQVDGQITEISFKEGQDVRKGDVLARIDPTLYQAAYDQAVAKKAQDEAQLANQKRDLAALCDAVADQCSEPPTGRDAAGSRRADDGTDQGRPGRRSTARPRR